MPPPNNPGVTLPDRVWRTKGFQFWTFLSLFLLDARPSRILELGAGRSTLTFAEYAGYRDATLVSLETDRAWLNKIRIDLRGIGTPTRRVHLVGVDPATGWYDRQQFRALIDGPEFDFAFIDGPNRIDGSSQGIRDAPVAIEEIRRCTANADVVIVDDVHRRHVLRSVEPMLADPAQYERHFYDYVVNKLYTNVVCICTRRGSRASAAIGRIAASLDVTLYPTLNESDCPRD